MLNLFTPSHSVQRAPTASVPNESAQAVDRRRSRRIEIESQMIATTLDGAQLLGFSRDLSREGTAVILRGELAEGEEITLRFCHAGAIDETCTRAIVRTKSGQRYGLEFLSDEMGYSELTAIPMHQAAMSAIGD